MKMNELIKKQRKELSLTQEEVADALGVSATAVYKWEKGSTYPDTTLLSPLARLLKVDLNTLFSFNEELTDKEIADFVNNLSEWAYKGDFEKAFQLGMEKIREYPTCDGLILMVTMVLQGSLAFTQDQAGGQGQGKNYEEEFEKLYQKAAQSPRAQISQQAISNLVSLYMGREDYDKAQSYLDRLPPITVDPKPIQASLYLKQGKEEEGLRLLEEMLLTKGTQAHNSIITMLQAALTQKEMDRARFYATKLTQITQAFEMGTYSCYAGLLMIAIEEKNIEETLYSMEKMLESFEEPWGIETSSLYQRLLRKGKKEDQRMDWPALFIKSFRAEEELDFLKENPRYQQLLNQYEQKKEESSPSSNMNFL